MLSHEKEIEILMRDNCTRAEAEKHLKRGAVIYEDLTEKTLESYFEDWTVEEEYQEELRRMVKEGIPAKDWGVVNMDGKTYYIEYAL